MLVDAVHFASRIGSAMPRRRLSARSAKLMHVQPADLPLLTVAYHAQARRVMMGPGSQPASHAFAAVLAACMLSRIAAAFKLLPGDLLVINDVFPGPQGVPVAMLVRCFQLTR